ncbi:alpha/beta hydrolase [Streptomyces solincola]|uniref:Alpha/beta hydrolase n=2 Tax=Streptomyces solincola TaxID=2100817 RepID=A0A2S9PV12_9ACTN|nr:alpha/beta hydrolase [Streptomyces solincola]
MRCNARVRSGAAFHGPAAPALVHRGGAAKLVLVRRWPGPCTTALHGGSRKREGALMRAPVRWRALALTLVLGVTVGACGRLDHDRAAAPHPHAAPRDSTSAPSAPPLDGPGDFAKPVGVDGRAVFLQCRGVAPPGSPTVVLLSGYGNGADIWDLAVGGRQAVAPALAESTRVCAYDRPGSYLQGDPPAPGRSTAVAMPRTSRDVVVELRSLLSSAGIEGPYVLVGHSLGGFLSYHYARAYPQQVLGLVSVDGLPADLKGRLPAEVWDSSFQQPILRPTPVPGVGAVEAYDLDASLAQAEAAGPLPPVPLTTLLAEREAAEVPQAVADAWEPAQEAFARRFPQAAVRTVAGTTHYLQTERPDAVVEAVLRMIAATAPVGPGK